MILAVDDDESEMICWYVLSSLDLALTHAKVPELRGVEVESHGGPGGGPLWPWGSGGPQFSSHGRSHGYLVWKPPRRTLQSTHGQYFTYQREAASAFGCWIAA